MNNFVHLHNHSCSSILDGMSKIPDMVAKAKSLGMPALALTDHGNIFGSISFYKECQKQGIKSILGNEFYFVENCKEHNEAKFRRNYHLVLLAENNTGWTNIVKLVTESNKKENFYYKPLIDFGMLDKYHEGIICLTACMNGPIAKHLYDHKDDDGDTSETKNLFKAEGFIRRFLKIFDKEHFYLEVQDGSIPEQKEINANMRQLAVKFDLKTVATVDSHYIDKQDAQAHTTLKSIGYQAEDAGYSTDEFYLKSRAELDGLDLTEGEKDLTVEIANRCNVTIDLKKKRLPTYPFLPDGFTAREHLRQLVTQGFKNRQLPNTSIYLSRLEKELSDIELMGFSEYFLIVWDVLDWCRKQKFLLGPGRGSAGGSLVSYCLGITDIDPIKYNLVWERFLNVGRVGLPDIDSDVPRSNRGEVLKYIKNRFGIDNTAQLATFNKMTARAVLKDVFRAFNMPFAEANAITELVPLKNDDHGTIELDDAIAKVPKLQEYERKYKAWFNVARKLEGCYKSMGTHASAVVIADKPFSDGEYPLCRSSDNESLVFAWDMQTVDDLKLLKLDILGLSTLDIIRETFRLVKHRHGKALSLETIDLEDPQVFQLFEEGKTVGIFQLEKQLGKVWSKALKPKNIDEIAQLVSLIRPGCLDSKMTEEYKLIKNGEKLPSYITSELKAIFDPTYGCLVFQEQVIEICKQIAGMDLKEADDVRRVVGKKKPDELKLKEEGFIKGCLKSGHTEEVAAQVWEWIKYQAGYSFNKSHAIGYALLAYYTAYLKVYYPVEFICANLRNAAYAQDSFDEINKFVNDAKLFGIKITPPSLANGNADFDVIDDRTIAFGLSALKGVGDKSLDKLLKCSKGINNFNQFINVVMINKINKKVVEALIQGGAIDNFGVSRIQMMARYRLLEQLTANEVNYLLDKDPAQWINALKDLVDESRVEANKLVTKVPNSRRRTTLRAIIAEFDRTKPFDGFIEKLAGEKHFLGIALSGSEADMFKSKNKCADITNYASEGMEIELALKIDDIREIRTLKGKGDPMAFVTGSDHTGQIDNIVVFPNSYERYGKSLEKGKVVKIYGMIDAKHSLIANRIERLM